MDRERACAFRSIIIPYPESWKTRQTSRKGGVQTFIIRRHMLVGKNEQPITNLKTINPNVVGDGVETVGEVLGTAVGAAEGAAVGLVVGAAVGAVVGAAEGAAEGAALGAAVGDADGAAVGDADGAAVGTAEGAAVGTAVGVAEGTAVGIFVGAAKGTAVGLDVGDAEGTEGDDVGERIGISDMINSIISAYSTEPHLISGAAGQKTVGEYVGEYVGYGVGLCVGE